MSIKSIFSPRLAEHIPGQKRVYKNIFGKTVKTIELKESQIPPLAPENYSTFMDNVRKTGIQELPAWSGTDKILAQRKPISANSFIVKDKDGYIERANVSLRSGAAQGRYKASFKDGELDSCSMTVK